MGSSLLWGGYLISHPLVARHVIKMAVPAMAPSVRAANVQARSSLIPWPLNRLTSIMGRALAKNRPQVPNTWRMEEARVFSSLLVVSSEPSDR